MHDLNVLTAVNKYPSITIFAPMLQALPEKLQNPLHLKNLISQAIDKLLQEFKKREIEQLIQKLEDLEASINWHTIQKGIIMCINADMAEIYHINFPIKEKVVIDKTFAIREILFGLQRAPRYWVLGLSTKPARLFLGNGPVIHEVDGEFPFDLHYEVYDDKAKQAVDSGARGAAYFDDFQEHFIRKLDQALKEPFSGNNFPIILLGTEKNRALFMEVSPFKQRVIAQHEGDVAKSHVEQIAQIAYPLMQEQLKKQAEAVRKHFIEKVGTPLHAFSMREVWRVAHEKRVHILLVEKGFTFFGKINPENPENFVEYDNAEPAGVEDLVDYLIHEVINTGGDVVFVEPGTLKDYQQIGAILRY
jgi:hypothetical protein